MVKKFERIYITDEQLKELKDINKTPNKAINKLIKLREVLLKLNKEPEILLSLELI